MRLFSDTRSVLEYLPRSTVVSVYVDLEYRGKLLTVSREWPFLKDEHP